MKQFGTNFIKSDFAFKDQTISFVANHVAIKNKITRLSHTSTISYGKAEEFMQKMSTSSHVGTDIFDAAMW